MCAACGVFPQESPQPQPRHITASTSLSRTCPPRFGPEQMWMPHFPLLGQEKWVFKSLLQVQAVYFIQLPFRIRTLKPRVFNSRLTYDYSKSWDYKHHYIHPPVRSLREANPLWNIQHIQFCDGSLPTQDPLGWAPNKIQLSLALPYS